MTRAGLYLSWNTLASSTPLGREAVSRRASTTKSALHTMAIVSATWAATTSAPAFDRSSADRMGWRCMTILLGLLSLELHRRCHARGAPRRQQPGQETGAQRDTEGGREHREVEVRG